MAGTLTVPVRNAETRLPGRLAAVAKGHAVGPTRAGVPVARRLHARMVAARQERTAGGILTLSRGLTLGGLTIQDLRDEGRQ
jgi:antitoxin (DNA-binding transcriptional repressor) of toxin-antitoxin stability system